MSHIVRKPNFCLCENKGADQLRSNYEADQRLCFRHTDSAIPLLLKSELSSILPVSVTVQIGLCRTWSEPKLLVFSRTGSNVRGCATVYYGSFKPIKVIFPTDAWCSHVMLIAQKCQFNIQVMNMPTEWQFASIRVCFFICIINVY